MIPTGLENYIGSKDVHLDLFSGLGLFSYAADHVWNLEHVFCEIKDWPYRFLKQEYPNARIERDIKNFDGTEYAGRTFLLTGGVPCQPASVAGKRRGTADDRWLWPEALRVLREAQPTWAIFENPLGILTLEKGLVFENLLLEMESQGYAVQPYIIPACAVGAKHRRYRIWIVAKNTKQSINGRSEAEGRQTINGDTCTTNGIRNARNTKSNSVGEKRKIPKRTNTEPNRSNTNAANTNRLNGNNAGYGSGQVCGELWKEAKIQGCENVADSKCERFKEQLQPISHEGRLETRNAEQGYWQKPWLEVATELCRVDVSSTDRIHRLKALGNTIQWEVAYEIMQGMETE